MLRKAGKTVNWTPTREVQARYSTVELFSRVLLFYFFGAGKVRTCAEFPLTELQSVALDHSATAPLVVSVVFRAATGNRTQSLESTIQYFPIKL